jgi:hypothetical protein
LNDAKSVLKAAEGSSLIFGVSDCAYFVIYFLLQAAHDTDLVYTVWAVGASESLEAAQGRNITDAAAATGAFLIWSTLPSIKDISNGTLTKAALYESKASVDKYIKSLGVPCVYFVAAAYMDLFKSLYGPQKVGCVSFEQTFNSTKHTTLSGRRNKQIPYHPTLSPRQPASSSLSSS